MENSPLPSEEKIITTKEKKSRCSLLVILVIIETLLLIVSMSLLAYKYGYLDQIMKAVNLPLSEQEENNSESEENEDSSTPVVTGTNFEGETITATVPENWTITEYYDGEGTDSLVDGIEYEGLTGIKIKKNGTDIFYLKAVSGIGMVGCPHYAKFADFSSSHLAQAQADSDEIGETANIVNYLTTTYSEFEFLNTTFRRVGEEYYYDTVEGNSFFEPPCSTGILALDELSFMDSNGYESNGYFYGPTEDATLTDLDTVDEILESIELAE